MMTALIIEDEIPAAELLRKMLTKRGISVLDVKVSAVAAIQWFRGNEHPDLVFMDICLRDVNCFRIFEQVAIKSPIIFTTAYDDFALKAFDYNSVAYLLKPVRETELDKAIVKFKSVLYTPNYDYSTLGKIQSNYKTSFLVSVGSTIKKINMEDAVCFVSDNNLTFLNSEMRQFTIGQSLDKLELTLDPGQFFRISRKFIVNRKFIAKLNAGNLSVSLTGYPHELAISRARFKSFVDWYQK